MLLLFSPRKTRKLLGLKSMKRDCLLHAGCVECTLQLQIVETKFTKVALNGMLITRFVMKRMKNIR